MQEKLQQLRKARSEDDRGFTLIELLVVVVIIGILIAIAIPLYLNYENGAKNKSSASDLRGAISTIEQCYTDNNSVYPASFSIAPPTVATAAGTPCAGQTVNVSAGTSLNYVYDSTTTSYSIVTQQTNQKLYYCYSSAVGGAVKTVTIATAPYTQPTTYKSSC